MIRYSTWLACTVAAGLAAAGLAEEVLAVVDLAAAVPAAAEEQRVRRAEDLVAEEAGTVAVTAGDLAAAVAMGETVGSAAAVTAVVAATAVAATAAVVATMPAGPLALD